VSSPNEPGQPGVGDRPSRADVPADLPPWQGGARRPAVPPQRAAGEEPRHSAVSPPGPPAASPPATRDPRSRYVTGIAAPDLSAISAPAKRPDPEPATARTETIARAEAPVVETYPSELPDLSAAPARLPQQAEAGREAGAGRLQVGGRPRGPVRASMQIRRIDPWSTLKVSALLSVALFFVWMIAVAFLYIVLGAMGVWSKLNNNVGDLLTSASGAGGGDIVSAGSIFGGAALVGLVNIVLLTAMATIGVYIYNLSTDIVGGVEVTLADLD
jgi:hypothetical protein